MDFRAMEYPYNSRRNVVYSKNGVVATSNPSAAAAGLNILRMGGNAIDAAVATAAAMVVVEPTCNGLGSDLFAIVYENGKLHGLNASGPSPEKINFEEIRARGYSEMPIHGVLPINVPGAIGGWMALADKLGSIKPEILLKDAIDYAANGFAVSPKVAELWQSCYDKYNLLESEEFQPWFRTYAPKGRAPKAGEIFVNEDLAKTLESIARTKGESFYNGEYAKKIEEYIRKYGGYLCAKDMENYCPLWVDPISVNYKGYDIWEMPPNGHGLTVLMTLNLLKDFNLTRDKATSIHQQVEALKLAYVDAKKYITDPRYMKVETRDLLSRDYLNERKELIKSTAQNPVAGVPPVGSTVYLTTADKWGNMVSLIQSNYEDFGSGIVVPGTSIALNDRGANFSLEQDHCNRLEGNKRSYHTIIPGFITKKGRAVGSFGVMGGFMQPQGHVQVINNLIDFGLNPQAALDAPRWQWKGEKVLELECDFSQEIIEELKSYGHEIVIKEDFTNMGRGQIILRDYDGVYCIGTEKRTDGSIASW